MVSMLKDINFSKISIFLSLFLMPIQFSKLDILIFNKYFSNLFNTPISQNIYISLSCFDLMMPFNLLIIFVLAIKNRNRFGDNRLLILTISPFVINQIIILILYKGSYDLYYAFSYIYGVAILVYFYSVAETFNDFKDYQIKLLFFTLISSNIIFFAFSSTELMFWIGSFYQNYAELLSYRLELMTRGPSWLVSYALFLVFLLFYFFEEKFKPREMIILMIFMVAVAFASRSRDAAIIFMIAVAYISREKYINHRLSFLLNILSVIFLAFSFLSLIILVFPINFDYPFLTFQKSQYFIIQHAHLNYFLDQNLFFSSGYAAARHALENYQSVEAMMRTLNVFALEDTVLEEFFRDIKGPHNSLLRLLESGGVVLLSTFLFLMIAPVIVCRSFHFKTWCFLLICAIMACYSEVLHYRWFWAAVGLWFSYLCQEKKNQSGE